MAGDSRSEEWQETPGVGSDRRFQEWGVAGDSRSGEWQETPGVGSGRKLQEWGVAGDFKSGEWQGTPGVGGGVDSLIESIHKPKVCSCLLCIRK